MSFQYTRDNLYNDVNARLKNKIEIIPDPVRLLNSAARRVVTEIDLRSTKRKTSIASGLYADTYPYTCPTDLKDLKVIDINPTAQDVREKQDEFFLVPIEEFNRRRDDYSFTIDDRDGERKMLISREVTDESLVAASLDSLTLSEATWGVFNNAMELNVDTADYVLGSASLSVKPSLTTPTTFGLAISALSTPINYANFEDDQSKAFVYVKLPLITGIDDIRLTFEDGSGSTKSYRATSQHDGTAFVIGWQLVSFNLATPYATSGTADTTNITGIDLYVTNSGTLSSTDYVFKFDHIILKNGAFYDMYYYSKYPWQSSTGVYLANSTSASDVLVADDSEYELYVEKAVELGAAMVEEDGIEKKALDRFMYLKDIYESDNPSEAKLVTSTYHDFDYS